MERPLGSSSKQIENYLGKLLLVAGNGVKIGEPQF